MYHNLTFLPSSGSVQKKLTDSEEKKFFFKFLKNTQKSRFPPGVCMFHRTVNERP